MAKVLEISGMIHSKFDTESSFAKKLGWPRQRLNKITTGSRAPHLTEVAQIADGLGRPLEEIAQIFLRHSQQTGS